MVTGHLGGLGSSLVECFESAGYRVVGIDRMARSSNASEQIVFDVSTIVAAEERARLKEMLDQAIGSDEVFALVNNAATQHIGDMRTLSPDLYMESFVTNALAPMLLARILHDRLQETHGAVINIGSVHTSLTKRGFSPYSISKSAMAGVTRAMAVEFGRTLRILEMRPAAISTPMLEAGFEGKQESRNLLDSVHPSGAIGASDDVAAIVRSMVEIEIAYINGCVLNVDGGVSHRLHDPE